MFQFWKLVFILFIIHLVQSIRRWVGMLWFHCESASAYISAYLFWWIHPTKIWCLTVQSKCWILMPSRTSDGKRCSLELCWFMSFHYKEQKHSAAECFVRYLNVWWWPVWTGRHGINGISTDVLFQGSLKNSFKNQTYETKYLKI